MLARASVRPLAVALVTAACAGAGARPSAPAAPAVAAWIEAGRRDDPRAAYALLAASVRRDLPYEAFARRWNDTRPERTAQTQEVAQGLRADPQVGERARVVLADGKVSELVREGGGWRLEAPLVSPSHAGTPQEALRLLARAVEARSLESALRVLTASRREGLRGALDSFQSGLRTHLDDEIVVTGDRAFLQWTDGKVRWKVTLVREDGEWRIDDVDRQ